MTDSYMPDVQVEVAFNAGYTTPAASRTWTDVSAYVELADGIDIDFGRGDERSTADANSLSLTLDNTDGRFTAGSTLLVNRVQDPSMHGRGTWSPLGSPGYTIGSYGNAPGETNGQALRITAAGVYRELKEPAFPVTVGDAFQVRAYGWVDGTAAGAGTNLVALWFYDAADVFLSSIGPTWSAADAGAGWIQREAFGLVPAGAVTARPVVRITAGLTAGIFLTDAVEIQQFNPYWPNVKLGRPIRVTATPPGGTTSTRFVGFVDEWPVEWEDTDAYAKARIRATSRLARLGLNSQLRSMIENEIGRDRPGQYFTLGDAQGSTAAENSSGTADDRLVITGGGTALAFGSANGPGADELTAVDFAGGQYLAHSGSATASGTAQSVECFVLRSGAPAVRELLLSTYSGGAVAGIKLRILTTGRVEVLSGSGVQLTGTTNVCNGQTHHVAVTRAGATWTLYVDGAVNATTGAGSATAITTWRPFVGGPDSDPADPVPVNVLTGTVAHAAFWPTTTLSATRVAAHSQSGTGAEGERTDQRLVRVLGWAGVPSTEITVETGVQTMTYQKTAGSNVVDVAREVESTEGGVLFDGTDGNVRFHNRSHRYLQAPALTLDMAEQQVGRDFAPKLDRSRIVNDATAENPSTGEKARSIDTASSDDVGVATGSVRVVADSYDPLQQAASWLVASYAEPRLRVPSLTVDVLAQQGEVNWLENPSFETNTNDWFASNGTLSRVVTTTPQGTTTMTYTSTAAVAGGNVAYTGPVPANPGEEWTASCWLRMITTSTDYRIYCRFYDAGGSTITQAITVVPSAELSLTDYTRISVTGTAPADTASVRLMVLPSAGLTIGHGFRVDGAMLTKGPELLDYFDGDTAGAEWSGTAHASTSFSSSPSAQDVLAVTIGDLIAVTNAPPQNDTTSPTYFVEGYSEAIGPESYEISFNVSPTYPMLDTLVLDDATRGVLDTNILAL